MPATHYSVPPLGPRGRCSNCHKRVRFDANWETWVTDDDDAGECTGPDDEPFDAPDVHVVEPDEIDDDREPETEERW